MSSGNHAHDWDWGSPEREINMGNGYDQGYQIKYTVKRFCKECFVFEIVELKQDNLSDL